MPTALANSTVSFCSESTPSYPHPKGRSSPEARPLTSLFFLYLVFKEPASAFSLPCRAGLLASPSFQGRRRVGQAGSLVNPSFQLRPAPVVSAIQPAKAQDVETCRCHRTFPVGHSARFALSFGDFQPGGPDRVAVGSPSSASPTIQPRWPSVYPPGDGSKRSRRPSTLQGSVSSRRKASG